MNYIIGSGLVAFIAKKLYPEYKIIPLGKSRYFSFDVATCDDYIYCNPKIDDFIRQYSLNNTFIPILFKRALSISGELIFSQQHGFFKNWLNKVYGENYEPYTHKLFKFDSFVYSTSCIDLFKILEREAKPDFKEFIVSNNKLLSINVNEKYIQTQNGILDYNNIINTIPLDAFCKYSNIQNDLESSDIHTFMIRTNKLDFEGATELLVADEAIDFYKCTRIGKETYQFYSTKEIIDLTRYIDSFVDKYDLLNATVVRNSMPIGNDNGLCDFLSKHNIYCVGSNAQWDDFMDIGSCIMRLQNYNL